MTTEGKQNDQSSGYHHGDLPAALRAATVELIAEKGPNGFSLREVARRAGVTHAAPAHHFGDSEGLLTSVAIEGFQILDAAFERASEGVTDPKDRITVLGKTYVDIAQRYPGHFAIMWSHGFVDRNNPDLQTASSATYDHLVDCITAVAEAHNPNLDIASAATMTWSAVHGLAMLNSTVSAMNKVDVRPMTNLDATIEAFTEHMMMGYAVR